MVLISITVPGTPFIITVPFDFVAFLLNTPTSLHILSKYSPSAVSAKEFKNNTDRIVQMPKTQKLTITDDYTFIDLYFISNTDENINAVIGIYRVFKDFLANLKLEGQLARIEAKNNEIIIKNITDNIRCSWAVVYYINSKKIGWS